MSATDLAGAPGAYGLAPNDSIIGGSPAAYDDASTPRVASAEIAGAIALICVPGELYAVQALPIAAWELFDGNDVEGITAFAERHAGKAGTYIGFNPIRRDFAKPVEGGWENEDVLCRLFVVVDCDPIKPKGVPRESNATELERTAARDLATRIVGYLGSLGIPIATVVDSGSGIHVYVRVSLENDKASAALVRRFLRGLASRFDTPAAKVDAGIGDAKRIIRLPGTMNRKGPHTPDRPHRPCRIVSISQDARIATREQLELVAGPEARPRAGAAPAVTQSWTLPDVPEGPADPNGWDITATGNPMRKRVEGRARKAFEGKLGDLAATTEYRQRALYDKALEIGNYVPHFIPYDEAATRLRDVAILIGLGQDGDPDEIRRGAVNGLTNGMANPISYEAIEAAILAEDAANGVVATPGGPAALTVSGPPDWPRNPLGTPRVEIGPFPVSAFPEPIARLTGEVSASMTTAPDYIAAAILAIAGAAIGQSVNLSLADTYAEAPQLYVGLVGPPGKKKSPPMKFLTGPVVAAEIEYHEKYREQMREWEKEKPDDRGPEPKRRRVLVSDITRESLVVVHAENPRGLLCYADELSGWLASFNQYKGGGNDRQFYLSIATGAFIQVDRKGSRESLRVHHPLVNVIGGLTPDNLGRLTVDDAAGRGKKGGVDDGFTDRLVFAFPDVHPPQKWSRATVSEESRKTWDRVVRALLEREMTATTHGPRPRLTTFTHEAQAIWEEWHDHHIGEAEGEFSSFFSLISCLPGGRIEGIWSKYRGICARIALILSRVRHVLDGESPNVHPGMVTPDDLRGAIAIVEHFKRTAVKVLLAGEGGRIDLTSDEEACVSRLLIYSTNGVTFKYADLNDDLRGRFSKDPRRLKTCIDKLLKLGCIREIEGTDPRNGPGRPTSQAYEINPYLT